MPNAEQNRSRLLRTTKRKSNSSKERLRLFHLHGGICHICGGKIHRGETWEIEHVIPYEISRDESDGNRKLSHRKCHKKKTAVDRKDIAKAKRREAKHLGAFKPKGRPMPGSKASGWKRKMDGTIVRREK